MHNSPIFKHKNVPRPINNDLPQGPSSTLAWCHQELHTLYLWRSGLDG